MSGSVTGPTPPQSSELSPVGEELLEVFSQNRMARAFLTVAVFQEHRVQVKVNTAKSEQTQGPLH